MAPNPTIARLCTALENLPLAIELAAARAAVLAPAQTLDRLGQRLDLLKGGRDADPRQASLRATIEWSYGLLDEREQRTFRRLAVFRGGSTLEAAEAVAEGDLDTVGSLLDKSLLRRRDERFIVLETIREFAVERLEESGEDDFMRDRHAPLRRLGLEGYFDQARVALSASELEAVQRAGAEVEFQALLDEVAGDTAGQLQPDWHG